MSKWIRFRRTSGARMGSSMLPGRGRNILITAGLVIVALAAAGCNYSLNQGAGFPAHIRTVAVLPFENETNRFELIQEVHEALLRQLPRSLGLNPAGEQAADVVISGSILNYDLTAPLYRRGAETETVQVLQREVVLTVKVEILDRENYTILWDQSQLRVVGQYLDASETEDMGRSEAIRLLVQEIVDGAQSNW
jgi:hypothetical protein